MVKTRTVSDRLRSPNFRSWSMKTSLANAFAVVRLQQIQEFHLWQLNTNTPNYPYFDYSSSTNQQHWTKSPVLLFHAIIFTATACLEHSYFLKVKIQIMWSHSEVHPPSLNKYKWNPVYSSLGRTEIHSHTSNYERFNRNNFNIRYWSWNYRGCWHQTCPPIDTREAI